jgi:nucleoside-diphosphate-sugar epimerase
MRVLVTGGAGFIGSHLVDELVHGGADVVVLDNLATGSLDNLHAVLDRVRLLQGDIRDEAFVGEAAEGVDFVFHEAALPSVARSVEDPASSNDVNVRGTLNVLMAARSHKVKRVVYASSSSVYGDTPELPKHEGMPTCPLSPYAVSKLAGELYCRAFTRVYGLSTVSLRYFNVFGTRQNPKSLYAAVIPIFIDGLRRGVPLTVFGDGEQTRDFTPVRNVVRANMLAMTAPGVSGGVFNVACGERVSLNAMIGMLAAFSGKQPHVQHDQARPGDVRDSLASIRLALEKLSYRPEVRFEDGLRMLWDEARR